MERLLRIYCTCRRNFKYGTDGKNGYGIIELQAAFAVAVIIGLLLCTCFLQFSKGWLKIQRDLDMQDAGNYMLAVLERELGYESALIRLKKNFNGRIRIETDTVNGSRKMSFTCDGSALYKKTTTSKGSGSNPVFIPGISIVDWQVKAVGERLLLISFILDCKGRRQEFSRLIFCNNGVVTGLG